MRIPERHQSRRCLAEPDRKVAQLASVGCAQEVPGFGIMRRPVVGQLTRSDDDGALVANSMYWRFLFTLPRLDSRDNGWHIKLVLAMAASRLIPS
jgi:hypothetical protein